MDRISYSLRSRNLINLFYPRTFHALFMVLRNKLQPLALASLIRLILWNVAVYFQRAIRVVEVKIQRHVLDVPKMWSGGNLSRSAL